MMADIALNEGKICKPLKTFNNFVNEMQKQLLMWDSELGASIKKKFGLRAVSSGAIGELWCEVYKHK